MLISQRIQAVHVFVLTVVVFYVVLSQTLLADATQAFLGNRFLLLGIVFLSSIGFYRLIVVAALHLINRSDTFLMFYWNKYYLKGFWSYSYPYQGKLYRGVWRIEQDIYGTRISGLGVGDMLNIRSNHESVTELIEHNGRLEVVMTRIDDKGIESYFTARMALQYRRSGIFSVPYTITGLTHNYGGPISGQMHSNFVFIKHENAKTEADIMQFLKTEYQNDKSPQESPS